MAELLNADGRKWGARIRLPANWRMSKYRGEVQVDNPMTRQRRRAACRASAWHKWRCFKGPMGEIDQAPRDDNGVMSRKVRRDIARHVAKQAFKIMGRAGTNVQRG